MSLTSIYHLPFRPHQNSNVKSNEIPTAPPTMAPINSGVISVPAAPLMAWVGCGLATAVALSLRGRRSRPAASIHEVALKGRKLRGTAATRPGRKAERTAVAIREIMLVVIRYWQQCNTWLASAIICVNVLKE